MFLSIIKKAFENEDFFAKPCITTFFVTQFTQNLSARNSKELCAPKNCRKKLNLNYHINPL